MTDIEERASLCPFDHDNCEAAGCDCWCHPHTYGDIRGSLEDELEQMASEHHNVCFVAYQLPDGTWIAGPDDAVTEPESYIDTLSRQILD